MLLICGVIQVFLALGTTVNEAELSVAIDLCKSEKESDGCLLTYKKYKNFAKIQCGEKL